MAKGSLRVNGIIVDADGEIKASTGDSIVIREDDGSAVITVDTSGNVGINTTAPGAQFDIRGPAGTGSASASVLRMSTAETSVVDADQLGRIEFIAPLEAGGTDAILVGASIHAEADATFAADNNSTELVFSTGASEAATEKMRIDSAGNVGIGTSSLITTAGRASLTISTAAEKAELHLQNRTATTSSEAGILTFYNASDRIASIMNIADGETNSGRLVFYTYTSGTATRAMDITKAGNVGIGSTAPNEKLDVAGAIMSTAAVGNHQTSAFVMHQVDSATSEIRAYGADASTAGVLRLRGYANDGSPFNFGITLAADGNVGIGNDAPGHELVIGAATPGADLVNTIEMRGSAGDSSLQRFHIVNQGDTGKIHFKLGRSGNTPSTFMTVGNSGEIGIGTTAPETTLHVGDTATGSAGSTGKPVIVASTLATVYDGTSAGSWQGLKTCNSDGTSNRTATGLTFEHRTSSSGIAAILSTSAAADRADIRFVTRSSSGISEKMVISDAGAIGVGTTVPNNLFHTYLTASASNDPSVKFENAETNTGAYDEIVRVQWGDDDVHADCFYIRFRDGNGYTGGITSGGSGSVNFDTSSDYRLKENVTDLTNGLERVLQLKPKRFNFIGNKAKIKQDGFIAHEVDEASEDNSYLVTGQKDATFDNNGTEEINPQSLDYGRFTPMLVAAIQELSAKVKTLEDAG